MTRIVCIGIAVLDDIYAVPVPLRPGEKHRASETREVIGGTATNAALAIVRLGGKAQLISRIGDDSAGATLRRLLGREGIDLSLSHPCAGCGTSRSAIVIEPSGERTVVNYLDPTLPDEPDWLISALPAGTAAFLGDVRWEKAALRLFADARRQGLPAVLDGDRAPADPALLDAASHVAFSAQGLREITGIDDLATALEAISRGRAGHCAVTDGGNGVFSFEAGEVVHYPAFPVEAVDTLAAGDVWHGAYALALGRRLPLPAAIRFASGAAALKCTRFGGGMGTPSAAELDAFLKEHAT